MIPLAQYNDIVNACCSRLIDKACNVRKNAIGILKHLVSQNPFSANLNLDILKTNLAKEENVLEEMKNEDDNLKNDTNWDELMIKLEEILKNKKDCIENVEEIEKEYIDFSLTIQKIYDLLCEQKLEEALNILTYAKDKFDEESLFVEESDDIKIMELIYNGMKQSDIESKKTIENYEGKIILEKSELTLKKQQILVQYLKDSLEFATIINSSIKILTKLMHSETQSDKLQVIEFYVFAVKFGIISFVNAMDNLLPLIWTKENNLKDCLVDSLYILLFENKNYEKSILELMRNITIGRRFALIELFKCFYKDKTIPKDFIDMLIDLIQTKTMPKCKRAMILLGMISKNDSNVVFDNFEFLIKYGISSQNALYTRETCCTILYGFKSKFELLKNQKCRISNEHNLFATLLRVILKTLNDSNIIHWIPMIESICQLIIYAADQPLKTLFVFLSEISNKIDESSLINLTRIISMSGQCALCILILMHEPINKELRLRRNILNPDKSLKLNNSNQTIQNDEEFNGIVMGASADDLIIEWIDSVCEYNLFSEKSILQVYLKLIFNILDSNKQEIKDHIPLRNASLIALGKYMLLSSSVCTEFLPILLKEINNKSESVACNSLIICGDIASRFPNIIEPYTSQLFINLKSDSIIIRRTTVTVLCHLILNDMIKIKGQISELALRINDSDQQISSKVIHFFQELSRKVNFYYFTNIFI